MNYNPFAPQVQAVEQAIERAEGRRAGLVAQLAWAARFDPDGTAVEIASLGSELGERRAELAELDVQTEELSAKSQLLASQQPSLERRARMGLNPFHWFSDDRASAEATLRAIRHEAAGLNQRQRKASGQVDQVAAEVDALVSKRFEKEDGLTQFRSFRSASAQDEIQRIDEELQVLGAERDRVRARKSDVDSRIKTPLAELREYDSEINELQSKIARIQTKLSSVKDQVAKAERIDRELRHASSKKELWELHQESERLLGDGIPGRVLKDLRPQARALASDVRDQERGIARLQRDRDKTEDRMKGLVKVASRDIRALVVDGNNCCYEGNQFIRLAALIPMTDALATRYNVTVVFDADIRGQLGAGDDALRKVMTAKIHVVATGTKADETILAAAEDPTVWVISNDRFGDYSHTAAVREDRVIRHEILNGRVMIHDLDLNVGFHGGPGGFNKHLDS